MASKTRVGVEERDGVGSGVGFGVIVDVGAPAVCVP